MSTEIENTATENSEVLNEGEELEDRRISVIMQAGNPNFERIDSNLKESIRAKFLDLSITVCIQLSPDEVAGLRDPVPYYVTLIIWHRLKAIDSDESPVQSLHIRRGAGSLFR